MAVLCMEGTVMIYKSIFSKDETCCLVFIYFFSLLVNFVGFLKRTAHVGGVVCMQIMKL